MLTFQSDAYEQLLMAVLLCAWRDATGRNVKERRAARAWLRSEGCTAVCDWLDLPVDTLRARAGVRSYTADNSGIQPVIQVETG